MRFVFLLPTGLLGMATLSLLHADIFTMKEANCGFEYPGTWKVNQTHRSGCLISSGTRVFNLAILPVRKLETIHDPTFTTGFDNKLIADGHSIVKTDYTTFKGIHFRIVDFSKKMAVSGHAINTHCMIAMADQHTYIIGLTEVGKNPEEDGELTAILNSFHFLQTPHEQTSWPSFQDFQYALEPPADDGNPQHQTPAYETAYRIRSLSLFIEKMIVPGILLGIIVAVIIVIAARPRRKK